MMCSFQMAVGMQLLWFNVDVHFVVLVILHFRSGWFCSKFCTSTHKFSIGNLFLRFGQGLRKN